MNYSDPIFNNCTRAIDDMVRSLYLEQNVKIEELTEQQVKEAFRQALISGDFQRLVRVTDGGQQVVYVPFQAVERLKTRCQTLEDQLNRIKAIIEE